MEVNYQLLENDFKKQYADLFFYYLRKIYFKIILISLLISVLFTINKFDIITFVLMFFGTIIFFLILNFGNMFYDLIKIYRNKTLNKIVELNIALSNEVLIFNYTSEKNESKQIEYKINDIKEIIEIKNHLYIIFKNNTSFFLKKGNTEFEKLLKTEFKKCEITFQDSNLIDTNSNSNNSKNYYWLLLLGLIPGVGLIVGCVYFFLGFYRNNSMFKIIGASNIVMSIFLIDIIEIVGQKSEINIDSEKNIVMENLNDLVRDIEFYKLKQGDYPYQINDVKIYNKNLNDLDLFNKEKYHDDYNPVFYYKKTIDGYILKSVGPDGVLNTKDDIYPEY